MFDNDISLIQDMDRAIDDVEKIKDKKKLEEEYEKAKKSSSSKLFNMAVSLVTAVVALVICGYFLYKTSIVLFAVIFILILASIIFGFLAKRNFKNGNMKKFDIYNKLSQTTGIATTVCDSTILKGKKGVGSSDKVSSVSEALTDTIISVSEMSYNSGYYVDRRYDWVRDKALQQGHYMYTVMKTKDIIDVLTDIRNDKGYMKLSQSARVKVNVFLLYMKDFLQEHNDDISEALAFHVIGALFYYTQPLTKLPDNIPMVGHLDNMFVIYCVYAAYADDLNNYSVSKTAELRKQTIEKYLRQGDCIWESLCKTGKDIPTSTVQSILGEVDKYISSCKNVKYKESVENLKDMWLHVNEGDYQTDSNILCGMSAILCSISGNENYQQEALSKNSYMDIEIFISCWERECKAEIKQFLQWRVLNNLYAENDVLTQYLNRIIGQNEDERKDEIKRLAKKCKDDSIEDESDRARMALCEIYHLPYNKVDTGIAAEGSRKLQEWAVKKNMNMQEAVQYVFNCIPNPYRTKEPVERQAAIYFYRNYEMFY